MYRILPKFTASPLQATAYLGGIALFSISFLVFLNATISFVITDVIGKRHGVGNDVGNLGFADELVALVACPLWGLVSDRVGVRWVAVAGYVIVGLSLVCLVQSSRVYPDLIIWRMLFSIGAAACTTMVTAVLPAMTAPRAALNPSDATAAAEGGDAQPELSNSAPHNGGGGSSAAPSIDSQVTITPTRAQKQRSGGISSSSPLLARSQRRRRPSHAAKHAPTPDESDPDTDTSRLAGFVGMFTGIGALLALAVFLPLPTTLGRGIPKALAVQQSFYVVGLAALLVAIFVGVGLRRLPGEQDKGLRRLFSSSTPAAPTALSQAQSSSYFALLRTALALSTADSRIVLGYAGGFVARAASVGVSLFIPLFVNAHYIRSGLCDNIPGAPLRDSCAQAYRTAALLSGVSQLAALVAAPLFGYLGATARTSRGKRSSSSWRSAAPMAFAAVCGVLGNAVFGALKSPDPKSKGGHGAILAVVLIGLGQIGAIVCSLGVLAQGIQNVAPTAADAARDTSGAVVAEPDGAANSPVPVVNGDGAPPAEREDAPLLLLPEPSGGPLAGASGLPDTSDRAHLKGTIAGVYSLAGGAAILLLTKLGGYLFDSVHVGAPFFLLAGFNGLLLGVVVGVAGWSALGAREKDGVMG